MRWYFPPQLPGQVETEVTQRDQFSNDQVDLSETIVRESIQNSLDAISENSSNVRVVFRWVDQSTGLDCKFLRTLFSGQIEHADAAGLNASALDFSSASALVISDFGTKGLTGAVAKKDDDNFSDFWRRHGKSHKTGAKRGRWGLGKLVYSTSSGIGAFFGLTLRDGDPAVHLMGQTVLNLRTVNGKEYPPHGFFADVDSNDPLVQIPVPVNDPTLVEKMLAQFDPDRGNATGLSVIIPFPNAEFSVESMIGTAIDNYFYPILTRQLVLQFNAVEVTDSNSRQLAHKYASGKISNIDQLFDFIEELYAFPEESFLPMKPSWADDEKLDEDDFEPGDLEILRDRFRDGGMVAMQLPVAVKKKDGTVLDSFFKLFLKRPESLESGRDLYVRGGLTLPGESKFRDRKALGAMIAEDEVICSFLGDAENAAHTQWVASAEKIRKSYQNPQKTVRLIKHALVQLYDLLAEEIEEVDEQALSAFFWTDESDKSKKSRKGRNTPLVIPPPPPPRPRDFRIADTEDGFVVATHPDADPKRFPQSIRIEVAYDTRTGNPFKKYNPLDFALGANGSIAIAITRQTATITERKANSISLDVTGLPFRLQASKFDPNRDLKVRLVKE